LYSCNLALSLGRLLELGHLLALNRRCSNLLTQNDVTNLASREGCNIDTVPFAEVL
jgi:hypothetical protein